MRIALDVQATLSQRTGIGRYTDRLLRAMRSLEPRHDYRPMQWGRDPVMRLDRRLRWQQLGLPRRAQAAGVDVLHVTGFDAPGWKPCPVVLTVHDLIGALFPQNLPAAARWYWSKWLPFTVRFADAIIADSQATKTDILRLLPETSVDVHVIYLGVDEDFKPQPQHRIEAVREAHDLAEDYFLFVGTLEPRKGIDTLIDAFARVAGPAFPDLVLVGKRGWHWKPMLRQIEDYQLQGRVHVLDYVREEDLPGLYSGAIALTLPSRYEGFGLPVLEAMACGTPVVCTNAASLPEVAGDAAVLVPPNEPDALADALDALVRDRSMAQDLAARGQAHAQRFRWEETARQTLHVYKSLLA
jgi:glycosyltransferase involved in cell wall biosynthesis